MSALKEPETSSLEIEETKEEERSRQEKNLKDVRAIKQSSKPNEDIQEENHHKKEVEEKQTTLLDGSGQAHTKHAGEPAPQDEKKVLPNKSGAKKAWGNNAGEETVNPHKTDNHHSMDHRKLSNQSAFFDSTISDLKTVFNTHDTEPDHAKRKQSHDIPLKSAAPDTLIWQLQVKGLKYIGITCVVCYIVGRFGFGILSGSIMVGMCAWTYWNLGKTSSEGLQWRLEKQENMKSLYTSEGESVEWLNYMLEKIWRSVDPEIFTVIEGLLEDTIQSVAPSFIKAVKVSDFDLGVQAPRIQMIRVFPPLPGQHEESIFGEASFSFHAHPISSLATNRSTKSAPPGLSLSFQTAVGPPLEVKSELTALSGKLRFKLLTSPEIPFVSKATIAFTSIPKIEAGVMPLSKHFNIMNLPTIKLLVNEGIKLGLADLVDPKSMTIDVRELMGAFTRDTNAIGIVKVEVRQATRDGSLHFQDMKDSYTTLSLSTQPKKSMTTTRVLTNDTDPQWDENLYILVHADDIVSETNVDVKVWDADKIKFDDMWGSVSMSVKDIVQGKLDKLGNVSSWCQKERVVYDGWTPIDGKSLERSKIKLNMKMSFHPKYATPSNEALASTLPDNKNISNEADEEPVHPEHTNGILSVTIHQAADLEIADPSILPLDDRSKHPYSPGGAVNPFAVLYINDRKVYRTRTKIRNPSPHWNAVSEHPVRNINETFIRISVKSALDLELDPVLGTKVISLKDLFVKQEDKFKEFQKWIPLADGIGFGKVLLTVKYKPVKMTIPRPLQGSDVATLVVDKLVLNELSKPLDPSYVNSTKATLALNVDPVMIKRLKPRDLSKESTLGWYDRHVYFPLTMRYRTALYIHIKQGSLTGPSATGRIWLKEMVDNEWQDYVVGLHPYTSEKGKEANRNENAWDTQGELGHVTIRLKIVPGFSPVHTHLRSFAQDMIGADPFYNDALKAKAQKWIHDQNEHEPVDQDLQMALEEEMNESKQSSSEESSEYGSDSDMGDKEMKRDMIDQRKKKKINKHKAVRKLSWSVDKMKHKVDVLREGFNSETRANRAITKEV
ncbi:hypothetical protein BY458DRAFT_517379 [Sporodiniella umbellata]|nr:hypothetical protein BY458DRAFT_517379 [Sporodiniella umbellata]